MNLQQLIILMLTGLAAGGLSGILGVGGGMIMIPALVFVIGFSQHEAQGTALAVMVLPVVLPGVINYYKQGHINIKFAAIIMATFVVGSYFGSLWSAQLPEKVLQRIFGGLLVVIGIKMFLGK